MIDGQWRAARALLGWSQADLAKEAGVAVLTIKRMEGGVGSVSDDVRQKAKGALEAAGVEFTNGKRPGVRLRGFVFRLDPIPSHLDDQAWQRSNVKALVWAREDSPNQARHLVARKTLQMAPVRNRAPLTRSPWLDEHLTSCTQETNKSDVPFGTVMTMDGRLVEEL